MKTASDSVSTAPVESVETDPPSMPASTGGPPIRGRHPLRVTAPPVETGSENCASPGLSADLVRKLAEARSQQAAIARRVEELRGLVLEACGHEPGAYAVPGFGRIVLRAGAAHTVDAATLRRNFPSVYRQVVRESAFVRVNLEPAP